MRRGMKAVNRLTAARVITDSWLSSLSDATLARTGMGLGIAFLLLSSLLLLLLY